MDLLSRLEQALGPGPMDEPIFPIDKADGASAQVDKALAAKLRSGEFDALFAGADYKPSQLLSESLVSLPTATVRLTNIYPINAVEAPLPAYPPIAKAARIEGEVTVTLIIDREGKAAAVNVERGHPMLAPAVKDAIERWRFAPQFAGRQTRATIVFERNCPAD